MTAKGALLAVALCAALGGACDQGGVGAPPAATSTATGASARAPVGSVHEEGGAPRAASVHAQSVPPIQATLTGADWKLSVQLDPRAASGTVELRGQPYALSDVILVLEHEELTGKVERDGGVMPAHAVRRYRLRFAIDECTHEPPLPKDRWPGPPCGYHEGESRPKHAAPYELLVDVESDYFQDHELHQIAAACVPRSGAGPSCKLTGTGKPI